MKNEQLMKYKNPVLLKDEDGKTKPSTFDLPPDSHTYGKKVVDDPEPVKHGIQQNSQLSMGGRRPKEAKKHPQKLRTSKNSTGKLYMTMHSLQK